MPSAERRRRHNRRIVEQGYGSVLKDPTATVEQKLKAADGLAKIQARRDRAAKVEADQPQPVPAPAPTLSPEVEAELARRDAAHKEDQRRAISARKAYFDAHPDRAGEVLKAIGPQEFLRITTIHE